MFNVAVPLVDRHLEEGRSNKVAVRTVDHEVTYRELADRVNRCGNALKSLGTVHGDRVLMVVKDCPEFFIYSGAPSKPVWCPCPSTPCCGRAITST